MPYPKKHKRAGAVPTLCQNLQKAWRPYTAGLRKNQVGILEPNAIQPKDSGHNSKQGSSNAGGAIFPILKARRMIDTVSAANACPVSFLWCGLAAHKTYSLHIYLAPAFNRRRKGNFQKTIKLKSCSQLDHDGIAAQPRTCRLPSKTAHCTLIRSDSFDQD